MYKPPLPEDDAPHDIPEFSYPPRRRKEQKSVPRPLARKRAPEDYNEDERPGEPITRRASLLREKQQQKQQNQTSSETSQHETTEKAASRSKARPPRGDHGDPGKILVTPNRRSSNVYVPQEAMPVTATSAYLLDAGTGDTLYAYNPFMHLPMLSTTKLMTASLAIEQAGDHLDQRITITGAMNRDMNQLSADSALFGIKQGEIYTL